MISPTPHHTHFETQTAISSASSLALDNDAWVISHILNSRDVLAYAPSRITSIWHVATGKGPYVPDPTVKLVAGVCVWGGRVCGSASVSVSVVLMPCCSSRLPLVPPSASSGKVLTRLGAWTVDPAGEVALKLEHPPGVSVHPLTFGRECESEVKRN